jgi:hypothetical protein
MWAGSLWAQFQPPIAGFAALGRDFRSIPIFSNRAVAASKPYRDASDGFVTLTRG